MKVSGNEIFSLAEVITYQLSFGMTVAVIWGIKVKVLINTGTSTTVSTGNLYI